MSGAPQGSHFGALLYITYINDIVKVIKHAKILLYVNDLKIYKKVDNVIDLNQLESDLKNVNEWNKNNGLEFNEEKCRVIVFGKKLNDIDYKFKINDIELEYVDSIKDLGIIFDSKLTFKDHIYSIISKAKKSLRTLKFHTRKFNNTSAIILLYNSTVKSKLMFGAVIWNTFNKDLTYEIEKVQNDFLRYTSFKKRIPFNYMQHDYSGLMQTLNMNSLETSRKFHDLMYTYKIINNKVDLNYLKNRFIEYKQKRLLRNRHLIFSIDKKYLNKNRVNIKNKSTIYRLSTRANKHAKWLNLKLPSINSFKQILNENVADL